VGSDAGSGSRFLELRNVNMSAGSMRLPKLSMAAKGA
jgi:hypothetical protein